MPERVKNLNFESFFTSKINFGGCFPWKACTYFQKICSWTRKNNFKSIADTSVFIWWYSSTFALEKYPKNLNFQSIFASERTFSGYFQWNVWTYFQKVCSRSRSSDAKSITDTSIFLVALLHFCFRKVAWKC